MARCIRTLFIYSYSAVHHQKSGVWVLFVGLPPPENGRLHDAICKQNAAVLSLISPLARKRLSWHDWRHEPRFIFFWTEKRRLCDERESFVQLPTFPHTFLSPLLYLSWRVLQVNIKVMTRLARKRPSMENKKSLTQLLIEYDSSQAW